MTVALGQALETRRGGWHGRIARAWQFVLGPPLPARVPERVQRAIATERAQLEILVSLIQWLAIVTFAALYSLAPKAFPPTVPFEPVPWALGVYAAFTALRTWLAVRGRLGEGMRVISTVIDMALLMLTIWTFHLQYQAPPSISLKAPTLMYVFILIALRALSFEARLVLLAGGVAVLFWLALVAYAVLATADPMPITRNFFVYTTSPSILLGAEFDKAVSIAMVALILAVMLVRARKLLIRAATEQQAAAELSRFFAPEIAQQIRASDVALKPGQGELRAAAVLFVDLRGFTAATTRLEPAAVMALLADYQDRVIATVHEHGGSIDKFMGDGVLASFGATVPSPTYAAQAMRAVDDLLAVSSAWARERIDAGLPALAVNAALATGTVLFGCIGNAMRLEYTIIGDPVNLAAKLEKHCKVARARAVATAATLRLAEEQGYRAGADWTQDKGARVEGVGAVLDLALAGRAA